MRWLLAILILANGVAFYWFSRESGEVAKREVGSSPEVDGLVLLSERPEVTRSVPQVDDQCIVIGPMIDSASVYGLESKLAGVGVPLEQWVDYSDVDFVVYVPAMNDMDTVHQRLSMLTRDGLESAVIQEGELEAGLLLGSFSSLDAANARKEQLLALGHPVEVFQGAVPGVRYWGQFNVADRSKVTERLWLEIASLGLELEISEKACRTVASPADIP